MTRKPDPKAQSNVSALRVAWSLLFGPIVWALHLAFVYGLHGIACEREGSSAPLIDLAILPEAIVAATLAALVLLAFPFLRPGSRALLGRRESEPSEGSFYARVAALLSLLSGAGIIWAGITAFVFEVCIVTQ
jgi:hypothetical protein